MKNPCLTYGLRVLVVVLVILGPSFLPAQDVRTLSAPSRSYAIKNVTVVQAPGRTVDLGTILIKDGLITAVGKNLAIPPDAIVISGDSLYAYAGFIDGLSRTAVTRPREDSKEKAKDPGNPTPEQAGITPYQDVRGSLYPADKAVEEWRSLGFTTAHVVPFGGMLPGTGALIFLGGNSPADMIIAGKSSLYSELSPMERIYPSTILGVLAKWKELYRQAGLAKSYSTLYASNRNGIEPPTSDRILEALYPVIDKQIPVLFKSEKNLDTQRILSLKTELGFNVILAEVKEGWDIIPKIKTAGAKVFLSLDLPEDKKEKDDKEKEKDEKLVVPDSVERMALRKRKEAFMNLYEGQAAAFQKASIPFGFSTLSAKPKDMQGNLRRMIKAGLTEDAALGALTIHAAQNLGVADRLGSIDAGKIANLVISRKPYFNEKASVRYVFVEGILYTIETKAPEKAAADKKDKH